MTALVAAGGAFAAGAAGPAAGAERTGSRLTLYQGGGGLVRESYRVVLPAGRSTLRLQGLPEALEPATVQAEFAGSGIRILAQRQVHDILTPRRALQAAVGGPVTLVYSEATGERRLLGNLVSVADGILVQVGDLLLLNPEATLALPGAPAGAVPRPVLDLEVDSARAGETELDLAYLSGGLGWRADYVLSLDEAEKSARLTAWVTLENATESDWPGARIALLAGDVRRVAPEARPMMRAMAMEAGVADASMAEGVTRQELLDYHLYRLQAPIDLAASGSTQAVLLQTPAAPVRRRYVTGAGGAFLLRHLPPGEPARLPVEIRIELDNDEAAGLGQPLPAGIARVFLEDSQGGSIFAGEDRLPATPSGEPISLAVGSAFDLVVERRQTDYQEMAGRRGSWEAAFSLELRNRGEKDVSVDVRERVPGDWKLLESSHPHSRPDASTLAFEIPLAAGGAATLTYRVKVN